MHVRTRCARRHLVAEIQLIPKDRKRNYSRKPTSTAGIISHTTASTEKNSHSHTGIKTFMSMNGTNEGRKRSGLMLPRDVRSAFSSETPGNPGAVPPARARTAPTPAQRTFKKPRRRLRRQHGPGSAGSRGHRSLTENTRFRLFSHTRR